MEVGDKLNPQRSLRKKDLQLPDANITSYYNHKYGLWLDFLTIDDNKLHGSGRLLESSSEGIRLQITKKFTWISR